MKETYQTIARRSCSTPRLNAFRSDDAERLSANKHTRQPETRQRAKLLTALEKKENELKNNDI